MRNGAAFRERLLAFEKRCEVNMASFNCSVHLCLGQLEVPVAIYEQVQERDWLFSTHRSHGHYLAKGGSEEKLWDEILGRESGVNGGFSGSQSYCDPELRFHSTAIVGGLISVATGAALAMKLRGEASRVLCCVGDAATEQGVFWESLNFAVLHSLPITYICENNTLSVHAPVHLRQARTLGPKVLSFGAIYSYGLDGLRKWLRNRDAKPIFSEVMCERECRHVSAMEDLRE